ncbi:hypothetical protein [Enterovirga aerilata]|uniref:Uncharacterized protein n=1 Tax=Enterovirga aerilata TaxID=2730920 RepID=A0A849I1U5_9HYPH|nr:hypothetical protein [Enterovirga sp. DB1703]NNM71331.1 hypothetical protein [Enterovirga sp. DB1703]
MTDRELRQWAERVVELYASRVKMTLLEQGALERDLAARFKAALGAGRPVADWAEAANAGLEEWERSHPQHGTRIAGFSETGRQVFEKRRT